jgi:hypothetical protein
MARYLVKHKDFTFTLYECSEDWEKCMMLYHAGGWI